MGDLLLAGADDEHCLTLDRDIDRATLRALVSAQRIQLQAAGLRPAGTVALHLPPSLAYIATLLAAWRIGAQVTILDYRLTAHEADRAIAAVDPQLVVTPDRLPDTKLTGWFDVAPVIRSRPGQPAATGHILVQLSSGSTGPSKCIARTAAGLIAELERYTRIPGYPARGERSVVIASPLHVLGLVGGLLHNLHTGVPTVLPRSLTVEGVLATVAGGGAPTTLLGVPSQARLLATRGREIREVSGGTIALPGFARMITGGEALPATLRDQFTGTFGAELGVMYGMTETGVLATDLRGADIPELTPAPGMEIREKDGELLVALPHSPYIGPVDPDRWSDGWLHTRDAGRVDAGTGRVTVLGRRDSQVSVRGLKVDLTEIEQTLADLPGVDAAVVLYDGVIEAYVASDLAGADLSALLRHRLARYKQPQVLRVLREMPRTATGKPVRDLAILRSSAGAQ
ncbi:long-chain fatty acid--CoA ligase [Nocardia huaxiensis]|uniref:Long-chain fatty acid--CoA ligase n=1 Tax=Nocardia huaxiensis TaxID=2755382 RepID=A0A7D6Z8Y8_9NOCA|nr:long-chain fatty acid--CoA ligase [Nocardia huaxiensis]